MTDSMKRVMSTPLAVDVRGSSIRVVVAADKYTVALVSEGMNDREAYARLFALSVEMLAVLKEADETLTADDACNIDPIVGSNNPHEHAAGLVRAVIAKAEQPDGRQT